MHGYEKKEIFLLKKVSSKSNIKKSRYSGYAARELDSLL